MGRFDLTDKEWQRIEPICPSGRGRKGHPSDTRRFRVMGWPRPTWGGVASRKRDQPLKEAIPSTLVALSIGIDMKDAGKPHKVASTAYMRKLLTILNVMARSKQPWNDCPG